MATKVKMRRDSKGRFVGKARSSRKRTTRKRSTRRRSSSRTRRRNPDIFGQAMNAGRDAALLLAGEAVTRSVPRMTGLPSTGPAGLAVQAAVAVAAGMAAERFMSADAGEIVMAAGLAVPLRSLIVGANVPVISDALRSGGVGAYVQPRRRSMAGRMGAYVQPAGFPSLNGLSAGGGCCGSSSTHRAGAGIY